MPNQNYSLLGDMQNIWDYYKKNFSFLDENKPMYPAGKPSLNVREMNVPDVSGAVKPNTMSGISNLLSSASDMFGGMSGGDTGFQPAPVNIMPTPIEPVQSAFKGTFSQPFNLIPSRAWGGRVRKNNPYLLHPNERTTVGGMFFPKDSGYIYPNNNTPLIEYKPNKDSFAGLTKYKGTTNEKPNPIDVLLNKVIEPQPERMILGLPESGLNRVIKALGNFAYALDPRSPGGRVGYMAARSAAERMAGPGQQNKALLDMAKSFADIQNIRSQIKEREKPEDQDKEKLDEIERQNEVRQYVAYLSTLDPEGDKAEYDAAMEGLRTVAKPNEYADIGKVLPNFTLASQDEPYKIGHIQQFTVGDKTIYKQYKGDGVWEKMPDVGGPRYKPSTTGANLDKEFRMYKSQLDGLYKAKASAEKGIDPFTGQVIPQTNIERAIATIQGQIDDTENYMKQEFPEQWGKYRSSKPKSKTEGKTYGDLWSEVQKQGSSSKGKKYLMDQYGYSDAQAAEIIKKGINSGAIK